MTNETTNLPAMADNLPSTVTASQTQQMFDQLMAVIRDPEISPEKLAAMLDVQERLIDRQARMDFNAAKMAALMEMPSINRDGAIKNKTGQVQSRYARFEDIDRVVRPICARHGLVYSFNIQEGDRGSARVTCVLAGFGHEELTGPFSVPLDTSGSKNATQGIGSAASYGKRNTLCAALNIVTHFEDNDGASATPLLTQGGDPDWSEDVLDGARTAATRGVGAYEDYFKSLSPMRRGWLVESGEHERMKAAAQAHD